MQGRPGGRGAAELGVGSGAGPGWALGSRRVFRRLSVAATSATAAASASCPSPHARPPGPRGARRVTRLAASPSHSRPAPLWGYECFSFPLSLHRRGQSAGLKAKWARVGQFIFHHLHRKVSPWSRGGTVTAQWDDVTERNY